MVEFTDNRTYKKQLELFGEHGKAVLIDSKKYEYGLLLKRFIYPFVKININIVHSV